MVRLPLVVALLLPAAGLLALAPTASAWPPVPCVVGWPVPCDPNGNFGFDSDCRGDPTPSMWVGDFVNNFLNGDPDIGPIGSLSRCYS